MTVLTPEKITDARKQFGKFDLKGNGTIPYEDVDNVLRALGCTVTKDERHLAERTVQEEMQSAAQGPNIFPMDQISFNDFLKTWSHLQKEDVSEEDQLRIAFSVFDVEGKQQIPVNHFREVMGKASEPMSAESLEALIREVDVDNDGYIDFWELKKVMLRT
mmetsp:Transcript_10209/g.17572  ORF Transcript_10209/g.17572 Transcript_10209/m.17572 type:complete len:161 (+) Transcript_10209:362-844(+)